MGQNVSSYWIWVKGIWGVLCTTLVTFLWVWIISKWKLTEELNICSWIYIKHKHMCAHTHAHKHAQIEFKSKVTVQNLLCIWKPLSNIAKRHTVTRYRLLRPVWRVATPVLSDKSVRSQQSEAQGAVEDVFMVPTLVALLLWERMQFTSFLHLIWRQSLCKCASACLCIHSAIRALQFQGDPIAAPQNVSIHVH